MYSRPYYDQADPAGLPRSRRSVLRGGTVLGLSAVAGGFAPRSWMRRGDPPSSQAGHPAGSQGLAGHLVLDYQPSQPTGWGQGFTTTIGGHTTSADFSFRGQTYQIALLSFGQPDNSPDPAYEGIPADSAVAFKPTLDEEFGAYYSFRYTGGFSGRGEFSVQSYSVFANPPTQAAPSVTFGANLYVVYNPVRGRRHPAIDSRLQWIQVINWPPFAGTASRVDNDGRIPNPFYGVAGGLTSIYGNPVVNFNDTPQISLLSSGTGSTAIPPNEFRAELFLAQDTGIKDGAGKDIVNILGGLRYGFQVQEAT